MPTVNLLFINVVPGTPQAIPAGFIIASISPASGASYTITNSLSAGISGVSSQSSPAITSVFTFPQCPSPDGYSAHTITATGGNCLIAYVSGF